MIFHCIVLDLYAYDLYKNAKKPRVISRPVIWDEIKPRGLLGVPRAEPRVNPKEPKLGVCLGLLEVDRNPSIIN